jgi:hypothetical protein
MARGIISAGGMVVEDAGTAYTGGANKTLPEQAPEKLIAAVAMVLRDEINIIRGIGLIGLTARSVDDIVNAIKAKLT